MGIFKTEWRLNEPFRAFSKLNGAKTDGFRRSEKLNEGLTIKNSSDYDEVYRKGNDGIPDGVLLRCHEGDGRPHGGGGDDAGTISGDGDRVSQAVYGVRRGLQEFDEEPVERHHQAEGRRARPHRLRDGARGKAVGREAGRPVAGHPRQARGAGVQGLRLPHDGGAGGREREDSEHGAAFYK